MRNNLFHFATSELSQDAFICWCLNWFNDPSKPRLRDLSRSIIYRMTGVVEISSLDIIRQFSKKVCMEDGTTLSVKIDVLAIVNRSVGLIIEDKTLSEEHDNQIYRYVDGIKRLLYDNGENLIWNNGQTFPVDPERIITVFWKTGYFYDYDKVVTADTKLDGKEILSLLLPYQGESDILDDYIDNLKGNLSWYEQHSDFTIPHILENEQHPQYCLMRTLFPAERWIPVPDRKWEKYQVYHGTSYGRPWTQMSIFQAYYPGTTNKYELFWRIDTTNNGPYISLRFYEGGLTQESKERHVRKYNECITKMKATLNRVVSPIRFDWEKVYPGYRGNYKEAAIFHVNLEEYLNDWKRLGQEFVGSIQMINDTFLKAIAKDDSPA